MEMKLKNHIISDLCIITDLDGTFLPHSKIPLAQDLLAVRKFEQAGGMFTIATGRTIQACQQYLDILEMRHPVIVFNGAMIYDPASGEMPLLKVLPEQAKQMTETVLQEMPHVGIEVLCEHQTWVIHNTQIEQEHVKICGIVPEYGAIWDVAGKWLKVLFSMPPEDMQEFVAYIAEKNYQSQVDFVGSDKKFYEMLPTGVSKGSALTAYRELFPDRKYIAVGDYDNDIEMLKAADFAVCPANAADSVKEISDLVLTRTCEQGAMGELISGILSGKIII
ncbi:MAG: HAD-IIB family hydrolase [Oscillospiraceae bacterium]|nr:HAD-IIB family hydrolase [Oscillospiraceae bacterium]